MASIEALVFDLGGVVIDWSPRHLFKKVFDGEPERLETFLHDACPLEWNELQDAGRSLDEATRERVAQFPEWRTAIEAYYGRWNEMIAGPVGGTRCILEKLAKNGTRLFALSNWSAETFPVVVPLFPELKLFEKIFISGHYGCAKPSVAFFEAALSEIDVPRSRLLFIDDNSRNIAAAVELGLPSIRFFNADQLRAALDL